MVILDEEEDQPRSKFDIVAGPTTVRFPDRATISSRPSSLLPDYETSQAQNAGYFDKFRIQKKIGEYRIDSRFWRATLYALAIYVALTVVVGVPLIVTKTKKSSPPPPPSVRVAWQGQDLTDGGPNMILAMDNSTVCNYWVSKDDTSNSHFSAVASHSFPLSSDSLIVQSNVSCETGSPVGIYGNLTADYNTDPSVSTISFVLSLRSSSLDLRHRTHVCFTDNGTNTGLSIYVPDNLSSNDWLSFSINILFPHHKLPNTFKAFATSLPMFSHQFGDLSNLTFNSLAIQGAGMDTDFKYLNVDRLSIRNSFAGISGAFRVTSSLNLDNIEGPILANVTLVQDVGQDAPIFQVDTGNGLLHGNFVVVAPSSSSDHKGNGNPSTFVGQVKTFNAPLNLDVSYFSSTPSSTPLDLCVSNSQANTSVTMDSKWSGTFDLQTKLANVQLTAASNLPDPSRKNRQRTISFDQKTPTRYMGWVGWGTRPSHWLPGQGQLQVVSSLSPILVQLGPDPS